MKELIIGISPRFATSDDNINHFTRINNDYLKQVTSRNSIPLILTEGPTFDAQLKLCDGFIIIGGDDIDPTKYNQTNELGLSKGIDTLVDDIDERILNYAINNNIPTLGICRGVQAMAAFMNGSLHQDLAYDKLSHPSNDKKHMIKKVANTKLSNMLPNEFLVNTYHHQSVDKVPDGFIVTYVNEDVIEAMEHKSLPFIGVQWHPERYYTKESEIIFNYFFDLVEKNGKNYK